MPLLGAIGNASQSTFRGNFDSRPFDLGFIDLIGAEPGKVYFSQVKLIDGINYKVPISITGDGEYFITQKYNKTFDSTILSYDDAEEIYNNQFPILNFDNTNVYIEPSDDTFDTTNNTIDSSDLTIDKIANVVSLDIDGSTYTNAPGQVRKGDFISIRIFSTNPVILENFFDVVTRLGINYNYTIYSTFSLDLRQGEYTFDTNGSIEFNDRVYQGTDLTPEYFGKTYSTTVSIANSSFTWNVITQSAGAAENLSFNNISDAFYSSEVISNTYTVSGLNNVFDYTADITSTDGFLSVNYGPFVKSASISNGSIIILKLTSSSLNATQKDATLRIAFTDNSTVASATTTWSVTTLDSVPSNLLFTDILSGELNSQVLSEIITIGGLSDGIDFNISITSTDGLLSVNGSTFVKSTTIRNGDQLQLSVDTSPLWLEEKNVVVQLENTSTTWKVKNRAIVANSDTNADKLIVALPYEEYYGEADATNLVRLKSGVSQTVTNNSYLDYTREYDPSISNLNSKYYTSSYKMARGVTTNDNNGGFSYSFRSEIIGISDFTLEMWVYLTGYNFNNTTAIWLYDEANYPNLSTGQGLGVLLTSNLWGTGRGKIVLNTINLNQSVGTFMGETTSGNLFNINQWNHVAITRSGNLFSIYVNGINRGSFSYAINLPRTYFNVGEGVFSRAVNEDIYIQDLRIYKGITKYTSNFNISNVTSIMEPYNPPGGFYIDSAGRILILSVATPGKDPRTLSKTTGTVLPGTDSCIDDTRWQNFLSLAASGQDYRLAVTLDNSTTRIINATPNNIQRMLNANVLPLRNSLTDWQNGNLAHDETSGSSITGLDYSLLSWTTNGFGYYGQSSNPFFTNPSFAYYYSTANWWILPPGVPDF